VVVPHGVDRQRFCPQDADQAIETARRYGIESHYFIQLGSWFPHKNLELSMRSFEMSAARDEGYSLVFVGGGAGPEYAARLKQTAGALGIQDSIHWIEDVSGQDLPLLLSAASALLQPSRYEGFALPLLEAMAVGLPGVVSDSSCLPEVSGGIWPIAGADDPAAFAAGMDALALDGDVRSTAIEAGLARAAQYTWEETARKTVAFFRQVIT
jgi:glycosyltransferase involved in cell wall biosynthesis